MTAQGPGRIALALAYDLGYLASHPLGTAGTAAGPNGHRPKVPSASLAGLDMVISHNLRFQRLTVRVFQEHIPEIPAPQLSTPI